MKLYEIAINNPSITSDFGNRTHPITGQPSFHSGLDLISNAGDRNLYAVADGYVQKVVNNQSGATTGYGNYIWVRYPQYDLSFMYAHCSQINLSVGQNVSRGTVVGIMGSTGAATGVHLHLGCTRIGSDEWLDPKQFTDDNKFNLTRVLRNGSSGDDVKRVQQELINLGYSLPNYGADGKFGNETYNAVVNFQRDKNIGVDGIVGIDTAHALGFLWKGN